MSKIRTVEEIVSGTVKKDIEDYGKLLEQDKIDLRGEVNNIEEICSTLKEYYTYQMVSEELKKRYNNIVQTVNNYNASYRRTGDKKYLTMSMNARTTAELVKKEYDYYYGKAVALSSSAVECDNILCDALSRKENREKKSDKKAKWPKRK